MPGSRLNVHLFRDSFNTPWGFRLQGGKDLNQPLTVQRVFSNSPAEGELQRGDIILSINNRDALQLTHKQAQDLIKHGGGQVQLVVNRPPPGAHVGPLSPPIITQKPRAPSLQRPNDTTVRYLTIHRADTTSAPQSNVYLQKPPLSPTSLSFQCKTPQEPQREHYFDRHSSSSSQPPSTTSQLPPWAAQQLASKKKAKLSKLGGGGSNFGTSYATFPRGSSAARNVGRSHTLDQRYSDEAGDHKDRLRNLGGGDVNFGAPYGSATLPRSSAGSRLSQPSSVSYGFQPTKVTLNKYGGSGPEVGSDFSQKGYGQTPAQRYEPRHDKSTMLNRVQSSLDNLTLSPRSPEVHVSSPFYQPYEPAYQAYEPPYQAYEPPYQPPQEFYTPTALLLEQQQLQDAQHDGEVIAPVWERRRHFQEPPAQRSAVRTPSKKPAPKFSKPRQTVPDLGADFSRPSGKQAQGSWRPAPHFNPASAHHTTRPAPPPTAPKYSQPNVHSTPPAWQRQEEQDTRTPAWRSSLKTTGAKPWEIENSYENDQQQGSQPGPPATNESGERDWSQSAVLRFINQEGTKKDRLPPPTVGAKPLYSPVQAPRSPQGFYQDTATSEF